MPVPTWTMAQDDALRLRIDQGHSPGSIALNFPLEIGFRSRNSLIGRCHRLGIELRRGNIGHPAWWTQERLDTLRKLYHSALGYTHAQMAVEMDCKVSTLHKGIVKMRKADGIAERKPSPTRFRKGHKPYRRPVERVLPANPVTIVDLKQTHCRAVLGNVDGLETLYCGNEAEPRHSYCAGHCAEYFRAT